MKLCNKNRKHTFSFGEVAWEGNGGTAKKKQKMGKNDIYASNDRES